MDPQTPSLVEYGVQVSIVIIRTSTWVNERTNIEVQFVRHPTYTDVLMITKTKSSELGNPYFYNTFLDEGATTSLRRQAG